MKKIIVLVLILFGLFCYWNFVVYQKKEQLMALAKPFYAACQTVEGCVISPNGWRHGQNEASRESMKYQATSESFEIRWHIATDVDLVASGGRGKAVVIDRVVN